MDATLAERVRASGAMSKEQYLLDLIESDCGVSALEKVLADRMAGEFSGLEPDWKDIVRGKAAKIVGA